MDTNAHDSLTSAEKYLILNPEEPRCGIIINSPDIESTIRSLATVPAWKSTRSPTDKLICRHKIPDIQLVTADSSLRSRIRLFTLGDLTRARANTQDWLLGIAQDDVEANLSRVENSSPEMTESKPTFLFFHFQRTGSEDLDS